MSVLTDRASLLRTFYRLTGTSASDGALIEHDSTTLEAVYQLLQYGLNDAQDWLLDCGLSDRWVSQSATLSFSGSESSDGGRYVALESDFRRLAGDKRDSALRSPDGNRWGNLVDFHDRFRTQGNGYWLQNERLWIMIGASPPSDLIMDYHHRLATLADSTTVDFPTEDRPLIVAYAATRGAAEEWLPGGQGMEIKIARNLKYLKDEARRRANRTREPRRMRVRRTLGTHYRVRY